MQPENDDMDDLYKRAAEEYPLNTDSADWNAVLKKMAAERSLKTSNKNYRHLLWLLLLLPLGVLYKNYFSNKNTSSNPVSGNHTASISKKDLSTVSTSKKTEPAISSLQTADVKPNSTLSQLSNSSTVQRKLKGRIHTVITANSETTDVADNSTSNNTNPANDAVKKEEVISEANNKNVTESKVETVESADKKTSDEIKPAEESAKKPPVKIAKQKEHGLYAGVTVGPDISTIKFQSVKKTGVSMGIIAGYRFNKKFSVESGVTWDIKNYYSEGEYFSRDRVYTNPNAKIISLKGVCNMIEVPVMIKYDLTTGKTGFSISGGVSSYFMKKEDYDYIIVYNNGQPYPHSSTYKNSSTDLAAVAYFAVGYNRQLKKGVTLRIEPYIKLPLKGVGMGSLPIMSTGLNLGITKNISR